MATKDVQRGFPLPEGRTVPDESLGLLGESVPVQPDVNDGLVEPTEAEERQADTFLGGLKDFIWDEGYGAIVEKMRAGQDRLNETIGEIAGRMVNREVQASDGGGNPVSRDLLFSLGAEVVNELFEVAKNEGIYRGDHEKVIQEDQGEALIHAVVKYGDMGDPQMDTQGLQRLASSAIQGGYPEEQAMTKMGIPSEMEQVSSMEMM